jgi:superfamily II DNA or RNA helicase
MAISFDHDDVKKTVTASEYTNGQRYQRNGRVSNLSFSQESDAFVVRSKVQGSAKKPYSQTISLLQASNTGKVSISGRCSCPVAYNCKHVAASLLHYLEMRGSPAETQKSGAFMRALPPAPPPSVHISKNATFPQKTMASPVVIRSQPSPQPTSEIDSWFERVSSVTATTTQHNSSPQAKLFVSLQLKDNVFLKRGRAQAAKFCASTFKYLKRGGFGAVASNPSFDRPLKEGLVTQAEADLFRLLQEIARLEGGYYYAGSPIDLKGERAWRVLNKALETESLIRSMESHIPLTRGEAVQGTLEWLRNPAGLFEPTLAYSDKPSGAGRFFLCDFRPFGYVDLQTNTIGELDFGVPEDQVLLFLKAPAITEKDIPRVRQLLIEKAPALAAFAPKEVAKPIELSGLPKRVLHITNGMQLLSTMEKLILDDIQNDRDLKGIPDVFGERIFAKLSMPLFEPFVRYGDAVLPLREGRTSSHHYVEHQPYQIIHHTKSEREYALFLEKIGMETAFEEPEKAPQEEAIPYMLTETWANRAFRTLFKDRTSWGSAVSPMLFFDHIVPALEAEGIEVVFTSFPKPEFIHADDDGTVSADLIEGSGIDWFDLSLGVTINGKRVNLIPALVDLIARISTTFQEMIADGEEEGLTDKEFLEQFFADSGNTLYLPIQSGEKDTSAMLSLPLEKVRPILESLYDLFQSGALSEGDEKIGFTPLNAVDLAAFEAMTHRAGLLWRGGERLLEVGRKLRDSRGIPVATIPDSFQATLRPYQARGVDWLQFLRSVSIGGILADDMGLGKTVQALAHICIEKEEGRLDKPVLILAPTSLMSNWRRESARFAPHLKVHISHGNDRKSAFDGLQGNDIVVTTYPLLARDHEILGAIEWYMIILDEAQVIKNPEAATTQLVHKLKAEHRICLSGTPMENNLGEIWSLFTFLAPGFLGDRKTFNSRYRVPIEKQNNLTVQKQLSKRVKPFLLRRTKTEVATELPPKTEIMEVVEMDDAQRAVYESIRIAMHAKVQAAIATKGLNRSRIEILDALLKMRQVCCDPRLLKLASAKKAPSAKLQRLMEMLPELLAEGRKILLFSQFTSMLALIEDELKKLKISYALLTGDTRDRETQIGRFTDGEVPIFLISLKAGGVGLNLTAADTVIHYDPWWNPAVEDQATDRAYRIGQDKPVFVYKMSVQGSIEEKMESLKTKKRDLAAGLFDPESASVTDLTEDDITDFFSAAA